MAEMVAIVKMVIVVLMDIMHKIIQVVTKIVQMVTMEVEEKMVVQVEMVALVLKQEKLK